MAKVQKHLPRLSRPTCGRHLSRLYITHAAFGQHLGTAIAESLLDERFGMLRGHQIQRNHRMRKNLDLLRPDAATGLLRTGHQLPHLGIAKTYCKTSDYDVGKNENITTFCLRVLHHMPSVLPCTVQPCPPGPVSSSVLQAELLMVLVPTLWQIRNFSTSSRLLCLENMEEQSLSDDMLREDRNRMHFDAVACANVLREGNNYPNVFCDSIAAGGWLQKQVNICRPRARQGSPQLVA